MSCKNNFITLQYVLFNVPNRLFSYFSFYFIFYENCTYRVVLFIEDEAVPTL